MRRAGLVETCCAPVDCNAIASVRMERSLFTPCPERRVSEARPLGRAGWCIQPLLTRGLLTPSLYRRFELWLAGPDFFISAGRVHIVSKTAGRIIAVLLHHKFPRQELHRDLAALRVGWNENCNVA